MTPISPSPRQMSIERLLSPSSSDSVVTNKEVMDDEVRDTVSQPSRASALPSAAREVQRDLVSGASAIHPDFLPALYRAEGGTRLLLSPDSPQLERGIMSGTPMRTIVSRPWDRPLLSPSSSPSLRSISAKQARIEQADGQTFLAHNRAGR